MAISVHSKIRSKADLIATLRPEAWDVNPPQNFPFTNAHVELLVADALKSAVPAIANKAFARRAGELSKRMAGGATTAMMAGWEPGDDICPPWPWPRPWPGPWPWEDVAGPRPEPWKEVPSAIQIDVAHSLIKLSALTTSKEFNKELKSLAAEIATEAVGSLADEFARNASVVRKPFKR
jgi:hypothetical protein